MTGDELLAAGYRSFQPNPQIDNFDVGYQKRIRDEHGTRYFINVREWWHHPKNVGIDVEVTYNDCCGFYPSRAATRILIYAGVSDWTVEQVEAACNEFWERLKPDYYERD